MSGILLKVEVLRAMDDRMSVLLFIIFCSLLFSSSSLLHLALWHRTMHPLYTFETYWNGVYWSITSGFLCTGVFFFLSSFFHIPCLALVYLSGCIAFERFELLLQERIGNGHTLIQGEDCFIIWAGSEGVVR